jgi:hypothetical protein
VRFSDGKFIEMKQEVSPKMLLIDFWEGLTFVFVKTGKGWGIVFRQPGIFVGYVKTKNLN